jgi:hypothetical protein
VSIGAVSIRYIDGHINIREEITMQVEPYLFFEGRCEEAVEF